MTNIGITQIKSTCQGLFSQWIDKDGAPNALDRERPYVLNFPASKDVSQADKANRIYNCSATLYLAGAIKNTVLTINLTYLTA